MPIEIVTPLDLGVRLEIEEDGATAVENAVKKARAYFERLGMPTIAGDSSMYISGVPEHKQPGLHVKRVDGKELPDEELIEYYSKLVGEYGDDREAWYVTGMALIGEKGLETALIEEERFIMTTRRDTLHGYKVSPLDVISIDPVCHKYYSEMTDEEVFGMGYRFDTRVVELLKRHLL